MSYINVKQVWDNLDAGHVIHWSNSSYRVYIEDASNSFQLNHFTHRNGKVLTVRCISNYFGSVMSEDDLYHLFNKGDSL